jgi:hypothetical protein
MSTGELLTIDVGSELRTLCEAQLRGTWQVPAELVRLALRLGAEEVFVNSRRGGVTVCWNGAVIDEDPLRDLRSALDRRFGADERQRAIGALEASGMEPLMWAAGLRGARLQVECGGRTSTMRFDHRDGGRPRLTVGSGGLQQAEVKIRWTCARLDRRRALAWVRMATRFADAKVLVNGRQAPQGFSGGLYHLRLDHPLPCRLGLTIAGDEPVLWLLKDGVVAARAGVPGYPPFEAAVELAGIVPRGASSADLRRVVSPFLPELVDRAVWMMIEVAGRLPHMAETSRRRLTILLLRAACRNRGNRKVNRVPLISTAAGGERRLSIEEIGVLADRHGGVLSAIDPDVAIDDSLAEPDLTLVVSAEMCGLLSELIDVRFQAPFHREHRFIDRIVRGLRHAAEKAWRRVRGISGSRLVPASALRLGERQLLAALRAADPTLKVDLCYGLGAVRRTSRGIAIPRDNPWLGAAAVCVEEDPSWAYPLLLVMGTGDPPSPDLRQKWRSKSRDRLEP